MGTFAFWAVVIYTIASTKGKGFAAFAIRAIIGVALGALVKLALSSRSVIVPDVEQTVEQTQATRLDPHKQEEVLDPEWVEAMIRMAEAQRFAHYE